MPIDPICKITYGLFVCSSLDSASREVGCVVNTVCQVTSTPQQVSLTVNKENYPCSAISASGIFAVSLLDETTPFELIKNFGFQSSRDADKFASWKTGKTADGLPYLKDHTCAYLGCRVKQTIDLGTHIMFIGEITECGGLSEKEPLSYAYYHKFIKPAPESPKAGTRKAWRCKICGYVYEGETLPPDYVCPLCKHGPADFEPILI